MKHPPVFLFAFAQHKGGPLLEQLRVEEGNARQALQALKDAGRLEYEFLGAATLDDLYWQINRFHGRLAVFHFGGHSNYELLSLQDKPTRGDNLSTVLGMQEQLKLVFLNGCANAAQVQELWKKGVKAVIATQASIKDKAAMYFSAAFYQALKDGKSLRQAFDTACAQLSDQEGGSRRLGFYRTLAFNTDSGDNLPWGLYVQEQDEAILDWVLPDPVTPLEGLDFHSEVLLNRKDVNKTLVEEIFAGMAKVDHYCAVEWDNYMAVVGKTSFNDLQFSIYKHLPSVLGIHIRDLFSDDGVENGRRRLAYIRKAYRAFAQLMATLALADLWKAVMEQQARKVQNQFFIQDAYQQDLCALLKLEPEQQASFDYLRLLTAIHYIRKDNGLEESFPELKQFAEGLLHNKAIFSAYRFLESELKGNIASNEVKKLCITGEAHLGALIGAGAFLANYQLASINDIMVHKEIHSGKASYVHKKYVLRGWDGTTWDRTPLERQAFTCDHSVVFTRDLQDEQAPVWVLSPFLVDQNAFKDRAKTPKVYFWQGTLPDGRLQYLHAETLQESWTLPLESIDVERGEELQGVNRLLCFFRDDLKPYLFP